MKLARRYGKAVLNPFGKHSYPGKIDSQKVEVNNWLVSRSKWGGKTSKPNSMKGNPATTLPQSWSAPNMYFSWIEPNCLWDDNNQI